MGSPVDTVKDDEKVSWRRYEDGDHKLDSYREQIFDADHTHKCPTYVHQTPPCQGSCPSGEDIRGWLNIVRGIEKPAPGITWQEYAFRRSTQANPFPSIMGRVCPAPCEDGCNRNEVDDRVGINAVEQFIGDSALKNNLKFVAAAETGKKVAIIGGGPCGLAAAYQLRIRGHACTVFDDHEDLGGMMRYGIPGYRTPRDVLGGEIQRIVDMGVELRMNTRVGTDVALEAIQKEFDAVLFAIGAQSGRNLPVPGSDVTNCISGVAFLSAFNHGRLKAVSGRVIVVGGGDTSIDVASVARRLGQITNIAEKDRPENIVLGFTAHDVVDIARREGAEVLLMSRQPLGKMNAAKREVDDALHEGVQIRGSLQPVEVIKDPATGRAKALRVIELKYEGNNVTPIPGTEQDIECDLIVSAIGQAGDFRGLEDFNNGKGLINADKFYQVPNKPGMFVAGDIVRPHLLTTVIGQASVAVESIDHYLKHAEPVKRPKVDVHHFDLLQKLHEQGLEPKPFESDKAEELRETDRGLRGTDHQPFAVHNYEDRSAHQIIPAKDLFLGHFGFVNRNKRGETVPDAQQVLGHFEERLHALSEAETVAEAKRCMSCGMCFECDNCVIYCPQEAVKRTAKKESTMGRYVYTDYSRCIGCHICADVCPTGYIKMGLGE